MFLAFWIHILFWLNVWLIVMNCGLPFMLCPGYVLLKEILNSNTVSLINIFPCELSFLMLGFKSISSYSEAIHSLIISSKSVAASCLCLVLLILSICN